MGKRGGKRGGGGGPRGRHGGGGGRQSIRVCRPDIPKTNPLFEGYYNSLGLFDEQEKEEFWAALRRELPNSFRFTGSKGHALQVQRRLEDHYIPEITSINFEGQPVSPPTQLEWFPNRLAWQMTTPKNVVRRFPPFASFQKFLVSETAIGNINRQEVVSMIPPLLLDVKPGMTVLDLCAAPGSKSAQLMEMVHGGEEGRVRKVLRELRQQAGRDISPDGEAVEQDLQEEDGNGDWSDDGRSTGLLIANDVDWKRAHLLIHQMKRLNSPNLIVTNHDASQFPSIKLKSTPSPPGQAPKGRYLKFDRILADVPCSGDGTARKNPNVWKDWTPMNGVGLHVLQSRILVRSLQMLKVGGRVVYSTCSMNPVENEAVVAAAIDRCGGTEKVDLLDCSATLPGLRRSAGLKTWIVVDKYGEQWSSWEELAAEQATNFDSHLDKITPTMFSTDTTNTIPLERCMRLYPHHQDTGGFFVAVLEKRVEIKARPKQSQTKKDIKQTDHESSNDLVSETDPDEEHTRPARKVDESPTAAQLTGYTTGSGAATKENMEVERVGEGTESRKRKLEDTTDDDIPTKRPVLTDGTPIDVLEANGSLQLDQSSDAHHGAFGQNHPQPSLTAPSKAIKKNQNFEEPFKYLDPQDQVLTTIYSFYGVDPRFPRDRFLVRNAFGVPSKKIYYTSELVKEIMIENEGKGIKFVHAGVCMFVRQDVQSPEVCRWRIQTDGLPLLEAWIGDSRVMRLYSRKTFRKVLVEMFPKVSGGGWHDLGEIGPLALDMPMGCCVLRIERSEGEDGFSERMVLPIWRSLHSLNLMLPKDERKALLLRLYNDDSPLIDHHQDHDKVKDSSTHQNSKSKDAEHTAAKINGSRGEDLDTGSEDEEEGGVAIEGLNGNHNE